MANYLSLEEAAKKLGIPTDRLVELRSQGQVRGFRDGASWKFPDADIDRLADELGDALAGGSGLLVNEHELGSDSDGTGSDLELGTEKLAQGSDVNLVPSSSDDSDVAIVASKKPGESGLLLEIDSTDSKLDEPSLQDSGLLDLAIEPNAGSTGPITDAELRALGDSAPEGLVGNKKAAPSYDDTGLDFGDDEDSGDELIGSESGDVLGDDSDMLLRPSGASSLELMSELDASGSGLLSKSSVGGDVLSELDLLSSEAGGSGLISGDSEALMGSSGSLGLSGGGSSLAGLDDALDDDDDLMIADDDDDLVISNSGGDISIAGDSGINLMSPSDSGLSLESEPLDLAGSGLSALDLGAELNESGSGIGSGSGKSSGKLDTSGSAVDFDADEDFQLSASGIGLDGDIESGSQVIEVEDSDAIGEAVEFGEVDVVDGDPFGGDVFGDAGGAAVEEVGMVEAEEGLGIDETAEAPTARASAGAIGYEIPFSLMQVASLLMIICTLSLGGMLMTDLLRNLWTYQEPAAPVSSLTNALVSLMGWDA